LSSFLIAVLLLKIKKCHQKLYTRNISSQSFYQLTMKEKTYHWSFTWSWKWPKPSKY